VIWGVEVLFVHGAWEGPWSFSPWSAVFAEAGWACRSLTLPGHGPGEEAEGAGLEDYSEALQEAVWVPEKTVLVGHSMGGWLILKYLERQRVAASVLVAPTPFNGLPLGTVAALARRLPWAAFKTFVLGYPAALTKAQVVKELCFSEQSPDAMVQRYVDRLVPEGPRVVRQLALMRLRPPGARRISARRLRKTQAGRPHLIVASAADRFVTPAGLETTAKLLGAEMFKPEGVPHAVVESDEDRSIVRQVMAWLESRLEHAESSQALAR
jgi:hypothetical protein